MLAFMKALFRRNPKVTRQEIECLDTERLRALHAGDRCRDEPELLVAVWGELALREKDLQILSEPTISVRLDQGRKD